MGVHQSPKWIVSLSTFLVLFKFFFCACPVFFPRQMVFFSPCFKVGLKKKHFFLLFCYLLPSILPFLYYKIFPIYFAVIYLLLYWLYNCLLCSQCCFSSYNYSCKNNFYMNIIFQFDCDQQTIGTL